MPNVTLNGSFGQRPELVDAFYQFDPTETSYAGLQVLPALNVATKAGTIEALMKESFTQSPDLNRAPGAPFAEVGYGIEPITYSCLNRGLTVKVPLDDGRALQLDEELAAMKIGQALIFNAHEYRVAQEIFNTSTYTGSDLYLDTTGTWATVGTDIPGDVAFAKGKVIKNSQMAPNAIVMSYANLANVMKNTAVKAMFPGAPMITEDMIRANIAAIFGLRKLIISTVSTFGDDYVQVCRVAESNASPQASCIGRTTVWDVSGNGDGVNVVPYFDQDTNSMKYQIQYITDEVLFNVEHGFLLKVS